MIYVFLKSMDMVTARLSFSLEVRRSWCGLCKGLLLFLHVKYLGWQRLPPHRLLLQKGWIHTFKKKTKTYTSIFLIAAWFRFLELFVQPINATKCPSLHDCHFFYFYDATLMTGLVNSVIGNTS